MTLGAKTIESVCELCTAEGYPYNEETCKDCTDNPHKRSDDMSVWISARDKLPDAYDTVLCCCHYGENKRKMLIGYHDGDEWMCAYTVTHWAPLPEYPEDEEEEP